MSNYEGMKCTYTPKGLQARVAWPERRLETEAFDRYKSRLADLFATIGEPIAVGGPAGQALVCQARDETSHLFVLDSELRFGYEGISDWSAAQTKLVQCITRLPVDKKPGLKLDIHMDGELLISGIDNTATILDPSKLGLSDRAITGLPGTVTYCGVSLYMCEHPVHTTIRVTPGIGGEGGVAVYVGRRGLSFATAAQLRKALAETVRIASDGVARLIGASWLKE